MRDPWVAYVVVGLVTAFMLLGKKMMFFPNEKNKNIEEEKNKHQNEEENNKKNEIKKSNEPDKNEKK